jgi:dihydroorotate dehydrogenase
MSFYRHIFPALKRLDAERAHGLAIAALKCQPFTAPRPAPSLACQMAGLRFPSPIGLAAGLDKHAEVPNGLLRLGFGFVELGTLTPLPQAGNAKPRLFRLVEDEAVINRMGFNNCGQTAALARLTTLKRRGIIGVNIGANKDSGDKVADYVAGVKRMESVADYLTINISSPNTPGLRDLQGKAALDALLGAVARVRTHATPPVFLKVAPDLTTQDMEDIAELALAHGIDALIVSNTTISRPPLRSRHAGEIGGLSGKPLAQLAMQCLRDFRAATQGKIPLIAVGGIDSAQEAYARIKAGASLVQIYSALVYAGPGLVQAMNTQLAQLLHLDGFSTIAQAIGTEL